MLINPNLSVVFFGSALCFQVAVAGYYRNIGACMIAHGCGPASKILSFYHRVAVCSHVHEKGAW